MLAASLDSELEIYGFWSLASFCPRQGIEKWPWSKKFVPLFSLRLIEKLFLLHPHADNTRENLPTLFKKKDAVFSPRMKRTSQLADPRPLVTASPVAISSPSLTSLPLHDLGEIVASYSMAPDLARLHQTFQSAKRQLPFAPNWSLILTLKLDDDVQLDAEEEESLLSETAAVLVCEQCQLESRGLKMTTPEMQNVIALKVQFRGNCCASTLKLMETRELADLNQKILDRLSGLYSDVLSEQNPTNRNDDDEEESDEGIPEWQLEVPDFYWPELTRIKVNPFTRTLYVHGRLFRKAGYNFF